MAGTWVDCRDAPGWFSFSWTADMGLYMGPSFMLPPTFCDFNGEIEFALALPNPSSFDPGLVGDDTYTTAIYEAGISGGGWGGVDWDYTTRGPGAPSLPKPPLPPVITPGMHLYVVAFQNSNDDDPPETKPGHYVPTGYAAGALSTQHWGGSGDWVGEPPPPPVTDQPSPDPAVFLPGQTGVGVDNVLMNASGFKPLQVTNWLAYSIANPDTSYSPLPFPNIDLSGYTDIPLATQIALAPTGLAASEMGGGGHQLLQYGSARGHQHDFGFDFHTDTVGVALGRSALNTFPNVNPPRPPLLDTLLFGRDYGYPIWDNRNYYEYLEQYAALLDGSVMGLHVIANHLPQDNPDGTFTGELDYGIDIFAAPDFPDMSTMVLIGTWPVAEVFSPPSHDAPATITVDLASYDWQILGPFSPFLNITMVAQPTALRTGDMVGANPGQIEDAGGTGTQSSIDISFGLGTDYLQYVIQPSAWRYFHPPVWPGFPPEVPPTTYLRMTQRNDGIGIAKHPRLPVMNVPTSVQLTHAPRIGNKNTYS